MKFKLDFSIKSAQDRMNYIKSNINFSILSKKDIELCTNYVLYGKDSDDKSIVDKKQVYIKTKYNSYNKTEPYSLEAMMESPTFDETLLSNQKYIYKKIKPTIDKEKCQNIPGMKNLWNQIDELDKKLKFAKENNLDSKFCYHLNHMLIELRKEQYLLKDSYYPERQIKKNYGHYYNNPIDYQMNYCVYPCGTAANENDLKWKFPFNNGIDFKSVDIEKEIEDKKRCHIPYFNFLDKDHIYFLCLNYYDIKDSVRNYPDSPLNGLLWTLDFYIEKANLSEQQKFIVEGKKLRLLNKEICRGLMEQLGIYHQENYVSTIWNKTCQLIADAADLHYDEWCCKDYAAAWKKCHCCGKMILKDSRNFVKKAKSPDGFTHRCKICDRKKRRGEI